jgi:hypothetical protein
VIRAAGGTLIIAALMGAGAPLQCAGEPSAATATEDDPGEALYGLAGRFREAGDRTAWEKTLRYIIERYPASRFAATAQMDLEEDARRKADGG